jgi:signal transduction histidine kinase
VDEAGRALALVLAGRDQVPAWRSAAARRRWVALAWAGWALVTAMALAVKFVPSRTEHAGAGAGAGWVVVAATVALALPLAPRYPLLGWRLAFLGTLITPLIPGQSRADAGFYVIMLILFCAAGLRNSRLALWWMFALMLLPVWLWTGPDLRYPIENSAAIVLIAVALDAFGGRRRARRELAEQSQRAEHEQARGAVLEERTRIAREMHDVVAHHMSMIAVQAETAPYRLPDLPEPVRAEFTALSAAAREALSEMRRLLGVLRSDAPAERGPQPRLTDIPELVDVARRAGAAVSLEMTGDGGPVPPSVDVCAYRIVQESLSNAGRHAPGAAISVQIGRESEAVVLSITNEPVPDSSGAVRPGGSGQGLTGMRERVALVGGSLQAGPDRRGGFAVRAVLPVGAEALR